MDCTRDARHAARAHRRQWHTLLIIVATALLAAGLIPALPSTAGALPPPCEDGGPPPCDAPDPEPEPDPEPPPVEPPAPTPPPNAECDDPAGFTRPVDVPPGYVYTPTKFSGAIEDPQPDDTFAADAAGHAPYVGRLRTRAVNGHEEFLVCAHVGTNKPVDALTPFPTSVHAATIAPRVVTIDATGVATAYDVNTPGVTAVLSHYAGSTDVHEGYVQMWVPFTPNLHEPGFIVRVEIRGRPNLPGGGTNKVMGADEVYVHLGGSPAHRSTRIVEAVGVALDDSVLADRPEDPGPDDLSTLIAPRVEPMIAARIASLAPYAIDPEWGLVPERALVKLTAGTVDSLPTSVNSFALDVENFNDTEGRGVISFKGTASPKMTLTPRTVGAVTIAYGSCATDATLSFEVRAGFTVDLSADGARPVINIGFVDATGTVTSVETDGTLVASYLGLPGPFPCEWLEGQMEDGIVEQVNEKLRALDSNTALLNEIEVELGKMLKAGDLAAGPLSTADVSLPGGLGFILNSPRYVPTAPVGHIGGDVFISREGVNLAAGVLVYDQGGDRFQYTYVPTAQRSLVAATSERTRATGSFDVGLVLSGATVNQLSRALTAGKPKPATPPPVCGVPPAPPSPDPASGDIGLLDVRTKVVDLNGDGSPDVDVEVHPSVPPLYLPSPPSGWPAAGSIDLLIPSLRVGVGALTMATDVSSGLDASIDATNHLVPRVQKAVAKARFLRLPLDTNAVLDPAVDPSGTQALIAAAIAKTIPDTVKDLLRPVALPDLGRHIDGAPLHLDNLTVGTVGGGHLGVYVDVVPGAAPSVPPPLVTTWTVPAPNTPPTSFTTELRPSGMPGSGDYNVHWTFVDKVSCHVLYQSPPAGEAALTKTLPATTLGVFTDACTGRERRMVAITATVRRGEQTRSESLVASRVSPGHPPTDPPDSCSEDQPPDEDPVPPICARQPWKCPDQ